MANKGLGRGLSALFVEEPAAQGTSTLRICDIEPNPGQPRRRFDEEALAALAESIRTHGVLQPIAVRKNADGIYTIIAGERRWRAARLAGLSEIPALVLEADDRRAAQLALVENLQREDLNPIEEAQGLQTLMEQYGMTQEAAAAAVGRSRPAVANALRLLALPDAVRQMVIEGTLSGGHARTLLALPDAAQMEQAAQLCVQEEMSVRELEQFVRRLCKPQSDENPTDTIAVDYAKELSQRLTSQLGRRVTVKNRGKKGRLEIEYYNNEDLDSLITLLEQLKKT